MDTIKTQHFLYFYTKAELNKVGNISAMALFSVVITHMLSHANATRL